MHAPSRFKKAFMEQLLLRLRAAGEESRSMGLRERRDAVRLSSDVAMALAVSAHHGHTSCTSPPGKPAAWARALVARHAADRGNEALMRRIMGGARGYEQVAAAPERNRKAAQCRRIVRRSRRVLSKKRTASCGSGGSRAMVERRMVKARMRVLRGLVPGADGLRGVSLLTETLDYVECLKTQVELMQWLCKGSHSRLG
jgi:hypothetical protein